MYVNAQKILSGPYSYTRIRLPHNQIWILLSDAHGSSAGQTDAIPLKTQLHNWFVSSKIPIDFYLETMEQSVSTQLLPSPNPLQDVAYYFANCFDLGKHSYYPHVRFIPLDIRHCDYQDLGLSGTWYFMTCYLNRNVWNAHYIQYYLSKTVTEIPFLISALRDKKNIHTFLFDRWTLTSTKTNRIRQIQQQIPQNIITQIQTFLCDVYEENIQTILKKYNKTQSQMIHWLQTINLFHIWNRNHFDTPEMYCFAALCSFNGLCLMDYYALLHFELSKSPIHLVYSGYNHIRNYILYLLKYRGGREEVHIGQTLPTQTQDIEPHNVKRTHIMDKRFESVQ